MPVEATAEGASEGRAPASLGAALLGGAALLAGFLASALAYLRAFGDTIVPLGPDLFGYVWQTRALGEVPLWAIEARPGVPILGSMLAGFGLTENAVAPFVVAPVMIVALGFAVAAALRLAFRLPTWSLGAIGVVVGLWGGSVSLAQGHLANLLSLVCIAPALVLLTVPGGRWWGRMLAAVACATASGLAHAGLLPFYLAAAGLWFIASIPALLRARREGGRWWQEPSISLVIALMAAGAVVGALIFGVIGWRLGDFTNIGDRVSDFSIRLSQTATAVGLWASATTVLAIVGAIAVWRLATTSSRAITVLGLAWLALSVVGGILALRDPTLPGHRALGVIVPLPAMAGLGVVGIGLAIRGRRTGRAEERTVIGAGRGIVAASAVVALCILVVSPGLERLEKRADRKPRGGPARAIASYLAAVDPHVPVVVFVDPAGRLAALSWRGRQNQVRAMAPVGSIDRVFFLIGRLGADGLPEPGVAPGREGHRAFEYAVEQSWAAGGTAMQEGAIVVVAQAFVRPQAWNQVAADPSRVVTPGVAVLRGPLTAPDAEVPLVSLPVPRATTQLLACLLALTVIGAGYGTRIAWARGGSVLDGLALAPAIGIVLVVLIGGSLAMLGADPAGPLGLITVGLGAVGGSVVVWTRRRRTAWRGRHVAATGARSAELASAPTPDEP